MTVLMVDGPVRKNENLEGDNGLVIGIADIHLILYLYLIRLKFEDIFKIYNELAIILTTSNQSILLWQIEMVLRAVIRNKPK